MTPFTLTELHATAAAMLYTIKNKSDFRRPLHQHAQLLHTLSAVCLFICLSVCPSVYVSVLFLISLYLHACGFSTTLLAPYMPCGHAAASRVEVSLPALRPLTSVVGRVRVASQLVQELQRLHTSIHGSSVDGRAPVPATMRCDEMRCRRGVWCNGCDVV